MLIGLTLAILMLLTIMSIILGTNWTGSLIETTIDSEALIDDVGTSFEVTGTDMIFNIDPIIGALIILIGIIIFAVLIGIQVLGSGLSPESIRIIITTVLYSGMWGILSILAAPLITSIEIFGGLIYISLTIGYVIGVIDKLGGGNG